ncbi:cell wall-associated NlpC family hydrolase [Rhodococcus wratislaviensis]|uniref:NlpC/P60 family protein n=3 Tax=Rhodococcus TaxID=1827 RepID=A0AB38FCS7_RHOWR|nr:MULTISPECIES: NlpC/P60 family protein [Rhodococcus]AII10010.1 hydrolase [Rhodococcus opacus]REE77101.1 cell wall-associated NlpC family hydrolase [Rhodococcus wratislaviensis]WAM14232.1 NlpC/P60 family protein [Rhodococcus sp. JS3073]SPZ39243.1 NlpC/P60 family protein [Rhodococcus wratislaviensis]GAF42584.1 NlpC/P60 family protein [Rhodococcus wratislaviensis NBRC 100605]
MASQVSKRNVRRAVVAGALAVGALTATAAPAAADPVTIPGVGTFEIPGVVIPQIPGVPNLPAPPAPANTAGDKAVQAAQTKLGSPYVYGAAGPNSFDCSGLVQWAFKQAGLNLPRTSYAQAAAGTPVSQSDLRPGDVVSFYGGSHSGIYAGNGNVIHASTEGQPVKLAPIASMPFDGARRY